MKITPLEIRQKTFEKAFRGLDKDEVTAFLISLSQEWEKMNDENKELKIKLESSEREVEKLREVENSLFKTLKTAEDTGANMIDQANKTAELHLKETEIRAEALMNDAKTRAKDMLEDAEIRAKNATEEMDERIRSLAQVYRTLENLRDDLISDIKSFANDTLEKTDRIKSQIKKIDIEEDLLKVKRDAMEKSMSKVKKPEILENSFEQELAKPENTPKELVPVEEKKEKEKNEPKKTNSTTSFFDEIE